MTDVKKTRRQWLKLFGLGALGSVLSSSTLAESKEERTQAGAMAMWTHGNSMTLEAGREGTKRDSKSSLQFVYNLETMFQVLKSKEGSTVFLKDITNMHHPKDGSVWVHFAIPTPTVFSGRKMKARKALFNFETTSEDIFVTDIMIMDGDKVITELKDLKLHGKHPMRAIDVLDIPPVTYGIGISLRVKALRARYDDTILFKGVGIDFVF